MRFDGYVNFRATTLTFPDSYDYIIAGGSSRDSNVIYFYCVNIKEMHNYLGPVNAVWVTRIDFNVGGNYPTPANTRWAYSRLYSVIQPDQYTFTKQVVSG